MIPSQGTAVPGITYSHTGTHVDMDALTVCVQRDQQIQRQYCNKAVEALSMFQRRATCHGSSHAGRQ